MALEDIFRALEEQARAECEDIREAARIQAEAIIADAEQAAAATRGAHIELADERARRHLAQRQHAARREGDLRVAALKNEGVDETFKRALGFFDGLRSQPEYPRVFKALAREALSGVTGQTVIFVDPADVDLALELATELAIDAEISPTLETRGGVTVAFEGGRILRRNTVEERVEKVRAELESHVAKMLFA